MLSQLNLNSALKKIAHENFLTQEIGAITSANSYLIKGQIENIALGSFVEIRENNFQSFAQVVSFDKDGVVLAPFEENFGLSNGAIFKSVPNGLTVKCSFEMLGGIFDALGQPLEDFNYSKFEERNLFAKAPNPITRKPITERLETGIKVIDGMIPIGIGQRITVFAEPGVGKSTLLSWLAQNTKCDVKIIALIGERGREVGEFLNSVLPKADRQNTIVIYSTSDEPPIKRVMAAYTATTIAEYFRDQGKNVLLMVDSLTRLLRGMRELGLASGEPSVRKGYPASVFSKLPKLIERTGNNNLGSITAIFTMLLTSDLDEDPMVEEVRSLVDGHIYLRRELAEAGHFPAIDPTASLSRLEQEINGDKITHARKLRRALSRINAERDLITLGGTPDSELKKFLESKNEIDEFLIQAKGTYIPYTSTIELLEKLVSDF